MTAADQCYQGGSMSGMLGYLFWSRHAYCQGRAIGLWSTTFSMLDTRPARRAVPGVLGDITVLELSQGIPGAYCGKLLAGLGARVIKVEPPEGEADVSWHHSRRIPPTASAARRFSIPRRRASRS